MANKFFVYLLLFPPVFRIIHWDITWHELETVSLDGARTKVNASKHKVSSWEYAKC